MQHVRIFSLCRHDVFERYVMFFDNVKLIAIFASKRKPLQICAEHILSSADKQPAMLLWQTKSTVNFPLEDKH